MKRIAALAAFAALAFAQAPPGTLAPRTVYLMPMAAGLDQYLARWLTEARAMKVITDPKTADTVMTDRLGEAFEQKMDEFHAKSGKKTDDTLPHSFRSSSGHGTVFLVDSKTRQVLWSDYEKTPRSNSGDNLDHQAERIVKRLQQDQNPPQPAQQK